MPLLQLTEKDLAASRAVVDDQRKQIAATREALKVETRAYLLDCVVYLSVSLRFGGGGLTYPV